MKRFPFLLSLGVFAAALSFTACEKDLTQNAIKSVDEDNTVSNRAQVSYGVNVYNGVNPCSIIELDHNTGTATVTAAQCSYTDNNGNVTNLDNIKGICLTSWGQYFLTTGNPANPTLGGAVAYNNALFKVNPLTGQCSFASTNPLGTTVSDLEHDPASSNFYGLQDNSNTLIEISDQNNNYGTYKSFVITGIAAGYRLRGLSLVRGGAGGNYLVGCATRAGNQNARLYEIPFNGGLATFITDLGPVAQLGGGHCGIGFDVDFNQLLINRNLTSILGAGLNRLPWNLPFGPVTQTGNWGAPGFNFEDLTSDVQ